ncbi:MAG: hypothetical protein HY939_04370 [Gammaproteobacteria bacterium]|nr:hypothetical protein [Gammaproteobacteria bacterium]
MFPANNKRRIDALASATELRRTHFALPSPSALEQPCLPILPSFAEFVARTRQPTVQPAMVQAATAQPAAVQTDALNPAFALHLKNTSRLKSLRYSEEQSKEMIFFESEQKFRSLPQNFEDTHHKLIQLGFFHEHIKEIYKNSTFLDAEKNGILLTYLATNGASLIAFGLNPQQLTQLACKSTPLALEQLRILFYYTQQPLHYYLDSNTLLHLVQTAPGQQKLKMLSSYIKSCIRQKCIPHFSISEFNLLATRANNGSLPKILKNAALLKKLNYKIDELLQLKNSDITKEIKIALQANLPPQTPAVMTNTIAAAATTSRNESENKAQATPVNRGETYPAASSRFFALLRVAETAGREEISPPHSPSF